MRPVIAAFVFLFFFMGCSRFFLATKETTAAPDIYQEIPPPLKLFWEKKVPGLPIGGLTFHEEYILLACGSGHVAALEMKNGNMTAKKKFGKSCAAPPYVYENIVYLSYEMGGEGLIAYDFKEKETLWELENNLTRSTPQRINSHIYHQSTDGIILCLHFKTGEQIWHYEMGEKTLNRLIATSDRIISAGLDGKVVALDPVSGNELWNVTLPTRIFADPVIEQNLIYIAGYDGTLYTLGTTAGGIINKKKYAVHLYYAPAIKDQIVYIPLSNGELIAASKQTLEPEWSFHGSGPASGAPLVTQSYIYYTTLGQHLYILEKTDGRLLQSIRLRGRARSSPYIIKNQLYVVYEDKYVACYIEEN
jgi:outer membrane protein assembly factor BamB